MNSIASKYRFCQQVVKYSLKYGCMSPMKWEQKNAVHFHARWDMAVQRFWYFVLVCGSEARI